MELRDAFLRAGVPLYADSPTNQQFVILPNEEMERLSQQMLFTQWGPYDHHHTICRFVTSWATTDEEIDELEKVISEKVRR